MWQINYPEFLRAFSILILTIIISKTTSLFFEGNIKLAGGKLKKARLGQLKLIKKLVIFIIYFFGLTSALYQIEIFSKLATTLFASAAIIGVILSLAGQSVFSNIFSGILIAFSRSLHLGDKITLEDKTGEVIEITLIHTKIKLEDGSILIIPNKYLAESKIINHSLKK